MARKAAIIEAATRLFAQKGFSETSTAEIAETAGVAHGTLFYHFKSKQGIIQEIFTLAGNEYLIGLKAALAKQTTGMDKIEAIIRFNDAYSRHHQQHLLIFLRVFPDQLTHEDSPGRDFIRSIQEQVIALIHECLDLGIVDGSIHAPDIESTANVINSLLFGVNHMNLFKQVDTPILAESAISFCREALTPVKRKINKVNNH